MYASDFPHEPTQDKLAGAVPKFLGNPEYDETAKANFLSRNVLAFYGIEEERAGMVADETIGP